MNQNISVIKGANLPLNLPLPCVLVSKNLAPLVPILKLSLLHLSLMLVLSNSSALTITI